MNWKRIVALVISLISIQVYPVKHSENSTIKYIRDQISLLHDNILEK